MIILGTARTDNLPKQFSDFKKIYSEGDAANKLKIIGQDVSNLHLIVDLMRLGANLFLTRIEYEIFNPKSEKNNYFNLGLCDWPNLKSIDLKRKWAIASFPLEYRSQVELIAKDCGLEIKNGTPHLFTSDGIHVFPLDGQTVFTLENIKNHSCYDNDSAVFKRHKEEEFTLIDQIIKNNN